MVDKLVALDGKEITIKFLGLLTWFTITDLRVTRAQLEEVFEKTGLDKAYLPRPINARSAFRRTASVMEVERYPLEKGKKLNLLIREVKSDPDLLVRKMVREVVDSKNVRLEYTPIANLQLEGDGWEITVTPLVPEMYDVEKDVLANIPNKFDEAKECYNGQNVRDAVWRILHSCHPVAVRPSGGVYFVSEKHKDTVEALKTAVRLLNVHKRSKHFDCEMWTVPVVDAEEQRAMVKQNLEDQVKAESQTLIEEMTKLVKEGAKIRAKTAQGYVERVRALAKAVEEYEELLETKSIAAKSNLEIAQAQAMALLEAVEAAE